METKAEIIITAENEAGAALNQVAEQTRAMATKSISQVKRVTTQFRSGMGGAISFVSKNLLSLKSAAVTALAGWGLEKLVSGFLDTGSSMDQLKTSLDTITKGQGQQTFDALNEWALKMPVNTQKAIESYTMMRAMGLQPAIDDMTTLVDTAAAIGGRDMQGALEGISRALGQIKTKGKVSTEELLQMAERGVPVFEILKEKMGLTSEEIGRIGELGLDADEAISALMSGMTERFGGQTDKLSKKWAGLTETIKAYWAEFKRMVMDSGVMTYLEERLAGVVSWLDELRDSGQLGEVAQKVGDTVVNVLQEVEWRMKYVAEYVRAMIEDGTLSRWKDDLEGILTLAGRAARLVNWVVDEASDTYNYVSSIASDSAAKVYQFTNEVDKTMGWGDYRESGTVNNNNWSSVLNLNVDGASGSDDDWSETTRSKIVPELQRAGYLR